MIDFWKAAAFLTFYTFLQSETQIHCSLTPIYQAKFYAPANALGD